MSAALLDTSLLLHAISTAPEEAEKKSIARKFLGQGDRGVFIQVLQEFYVNATGPASPP